jgi:cytochrome c oxidase subunit II
MPPHRLRWLTWLPLIVSACSGPFPQSALRPKSDYAGALDALFRDIFWWALLVFVLVEGLLLFVVLRYRHREGGATPKPRHGHTVLEIAWTIAPALILVFIAVPTMRTIFATQQPPAAGALRVQVIGHQWWWEYRYPELGVVTANEMHVPVGRPIALEITTADVIHSFWAPGLGGKRDLIPGHLNRIAFTAESTGTFLGQCAEFCGESHANMRLRVMVDADSTFGAWVAAQQAPGRPVAKGSAEEKGQDAFRRYGCIACHSVTGVSAGVIGPNLTHVGSRTTIAAGVLSNTPEDLAQWIGDPPGVKPGAKMPKLPVRSEDLAALVAYLRSLR